MMKTSYINDIQIETDGITVWVNANDGSSIARFGKMGIDIHTSITAQLAGAGQCLFCTHGKTSRKDWDVFLLAMKTHYQIDIPKKFLPARLH